MGKSPVLLVKKSSFSIVLYFICVHTFFFVCNSCLLTNIWIYSTGYMINYTKFKHFGLKCPFYGEKCSFIGKKVEFFNRIIFYMRTYLLLRLKFMLVNTYMDLFNWIYVINYTKFEQFWPNCPVYGEKYSFMGNKDEFFNRIIV